MPIYEYRCPKCGVFDVMQKITEKPLRKCPTCKGKVDKLVSQTSFQLKGSGWYLTDYAGKGSKRDEAGSSTESAKSDSSSSDTTSEKSTKSSDKPKGKSQKGKSKGASSADAA
jgi:putative FmdB family regulatory protein